MQPLLVDWGLVRRQIQIGHEPFQRSDRDWRQLRAEQARFLAVQLTLTNPAADARKRILLVHGFQRARKIGVHQFGDICLDIDVNRASLDALRIRAIQTAARFNTRLFQGKAVGHLFPPITTNLWGSHLGNLTRSFRVSFLSDVHHLSAGPRHSRMLSAFAMPFFNERSKPRAAMVPILEARAFAQIHRQM
jgi:hypothetical protein